MTETKLEPKIAEFLKGKGYRVLGRLGEGHTRDVYEAEYQQGSLQKRRVVKIPKTEINENSIAACINRSKGDLNEREVLTLNKVSHPNIIEIYDVFKLGNQTITVEEHYDAISLDDLVRLSGPIKDPERFKRIYSQVITGLHHLHFNEDLLHRDIKPSNILVGRQNSTVKITDLQTAVKIHELMPSFLPTRGGTRFTAPYLLNALFNEQKSKATMQSEFYALGATMFHTLTGQSLFDTELVPDEDGKTINGTNIKATLKLHGKKIDSIDFEEHEKLLQERLKEVPWQYRKLLYNCLSIKQPKYAEWGAHAKFEEDLEKATKPSLIPWKSFKRHLITYTTIAGIISGIFGGCKLILLQDKYSAMSEPDITRTLSTGIFNDGKLQNLLNNEISLDMLNPHFKEITESKPIMYKEGARTSVDIACSIHNMSRRLGYSAVRSALLENEAAKKEAYGETRYLNTLVPKEFIRKGYCNLNGNLKKTLEEFEKERELTRTHICTAYAVWHLKHYLGNSESLADLFAAHFCEGDEIFEARKTSGSKKYFPTKDSKGYSEYLPAIKRNIINRAIALYHITDNEGKIHYELLDSNNRLKSGLPAK